jgi:hypothetical protein
MVDALRPLAVVLLFASCSSLEPPRRSALQEQIGAGNMSATELRQRLYEVPGRLGGILETAADEIRAASIDPAVRRRALLWKADAVPALYTAALRPDPMAGALDLWLLVEQMRRYFAEGPGREAFGAQQPLASAAMAQIVAVTEATALSLAASPEAFARRKASVERFAAAHPIESGIATRESAMLELARLTEADGAGAFAAVGEATETLSDITLRLNAYAALLPKVARWQAELAVEGVTGRDSLEPTLEGLDAVGEAARRANELLADVPGAARAVSGPMAELLDRQRLELLAAVAQERLAITHFLTAERETAFAALSAERKAVLEAFSAERAAAMAQFEALTERTLADASVRAGEMGSFVFVRALVLIVAAALFFALGYRFARGRSRRDERTDEAGR